MGSEDVSYPFHEGETSRGETYRSRNVHIPAILCNISLS